MVISKKAAVKASSALAVLALLASPIVATAATDSTTITADIGSTITVSNSSDVNLSLTPASGAVSSSASDTVTVNTNSTAGFTLSIADADADTDLVSGSNTISPTPGDHASPAPLSDNSWGYAVAGGNFDSIYSALTNQSTDTTLWAAVPASGSADVLKTTSSTAENDQTVVWFGARVDTTQPTGSYTNTVTYTATANN